MLIGPEVFGMTQKSYIQKSQTPQRLSQHFLQHLLPTHAGGDRLQGWLTPAHSVAEAMERFFLLYVQAGLGLFGKNLPERGGAFKQLKATRSADLAGCCYLRGFLLVIFG